MAQTVKTQAALIAQMADGGDNTAEEVRDNIVSGWSPGWVRYLDHRLPSETAHAGDDFFTSDTTADYTAQAPTGTFTPAIDHGVLSIYATGQSSGDYPVYVKSLGALTAPVTIETRVSIFTQGGPNYVGLNFTDGTATTSNVFFGHVAYSSGLAFGSAQGTVTNVGTFNNSTTIVGAWNRTGAYLRTCWKSANTFRVAWSPDGVTWVNGGTAADRSLTMTPTHFGFTFSTLAATDGVAVFDYFRVYEADLVTGAL